MRNVSKIIVAVLLLLITAAALSFTLENQNSVSLVFFGMVFPPLAISILLISAFLLGAVLGSVAVMFRRYLLKKRKITNKG
jgi:uncharacterized integral membrane protein